MIAPSRLRFCLVASIFLAAALSGTDSRAADSAESLGVFSELSDVGSVSRPTNASYDASKNAYTIAATGENRW